MANVFCKYLKNRLKKHQSHNDKTIYILINNWQIVYVKPSAIYFYFFGKEKLAIAWM